MQIPSPLLVPMHRGIWIHPSLVSHGHLWIYSVLVEQHDFRRIRASLAAPKLERYNNICQVLMHLSCLNAHLESLYFDPLSNYSPFLSNFVKFVHLLFVFVGIVGTIVLPVLGAVPDGCIVVFSGLGARDQVESQVCTGTVRVNSSLQ